MASEVERLQKQVQQLKSKLNEKEKEVSEKDSEIKVLKLKLSDQTLNAERIEELKCRITQLEMDVVDRNGEIEALKRQIIALEMENCHLKVDLIDSEKRIQRLEEQVGELIDKHWLYIGEVALNLCENAYKFIMGVSLYEEYYPYYMTDIEDNIECIEDAESREEAYKKWETFQNQVGWKPKMVKAVKEVRKTRNSTAHCHKKALDQNKAKEAIEELNSKNQLKGYISKRNVQNIVHMWAISCNL